MGLDTDLPKLVDEQKISPGVELLLYRTTDNPTLAIFGSVQAGAAFEPSGKQGLAELMSRLLIRGTSRLGAAKLSDNLESVGAAVGFRNNQDTISFQARTISRWTGRILKIISDCLTSPAFRPGDIEKEREELITDIRLRDDDTTRRGLKELQRIVYPPDHPYRHDRLGTAETVKKIRRSDLKEYLQERMARGRVILSFAGMFEKSQVVKWAEKTFGERDEKGVVQNGLRKSGFQPKAENREIVMAHKTQSDVLIGTSGVARTDPDYEALNLLNTILGELGFMGRLGSRVRDKEGLAYSATSFLNAGAQGGTWTALAGVNPRNVERASELIMEELKRVRDEPVGGEELDAAKQNQIGSALMELESTEGMARTSHNLTHFGLGLDYFVKRKKFYGGIGPGELQSLATKYLDPDRLSTVVVGPKLKTGDSKS
jgi:zinc protease